MLGTKRPLLLVVPGRMQVRRKEQGLGQRPHLTFSFFSFFESHFQLIFLVVSGIRMPSQAKQTHMESERQGGAARGVFRPRPPSAVALQQQAEALFRVKSWMERYGILVPLQKLRTILD
jgi:hypothetical protein